MKNFVRIAVLSLSLAGLSLAPAGLGFAAGGGGGNGGNSGGNSGGGGNNNPSASAKKLKCKKNTEVAKQVEQYGQKIWKCVKTTAGVLNDDELYEQGRLLAKDGEYDWALAVFSSIKNQDDPKVLNYKGYSNRKAGRIEEGLSYYKKALAIDPDFVLAREYYGEGLVAAGRVDLAQLQLDEIARRCGITCEEYEDLAAVIAGAGN